MSIFSPNVGHQEKIVSKSYTTAIPLNSFNDFHPVATFWFSSKSGRPKTLLNARGSFIWNDHQSRILYVYEPPHDKTNKMTCAPSKDLDQPGHSPSLIRVFAMHFMGSLGPNASCGQRRLIRLGTQVILLVLSWCGSIMLAADCSVLLMTDRWQIIITWLSNVQHWFFKFLQGTVSVWEYKAILTISNLVCRDCFGSTRLFWLYQI